MSNYADLRKLQYILNIVLEDYKLINNITNQGLVPVNFGLNKKSNKQLATSRINEFYIMHRDNFKELLHELSNINLDDNVFEKHIKDSLNKLAQ